jgi:uncharacterized OB-fold protein
MFILTCSCCQSSFVPPKYVCSNCQSKTFEKKKIKGNGRIFSYTIIHVAPESHQEQAPYKVVLVELNEGLRVTGRLVNDIDDVQIGSLINFCYEDENGIWFEVNKQVNPSLEVKE